VAIAVLDGPVDLTHPCFEGADLRVVTTLVKDAAGADTMSLHGTHVASILFGRPGTSVEGIAPGCRGLLLPVFTEGRSLSQVDLARAIEQAVREGADVISISGGQRSETGQPDGILANALALCEERDVLVIAAAGNEGTDRVQVPAAIASVLAVGAANAQGEPLASSNWGMDYQSHGVLAMGDRIPGAAPGGGTATLSGTSIATPIVAGVAALLLVLHRRATPGALAVDVRRWIVAGAQGPIVNDAEPRQRPAGLLDIAATLRDLREGVVMETVEGDTTTAAQPESRDDREAVATETASGTAVPTAAPAVPAIVPAAGGDAAPMGHTACACGGCDTRSGRSPVFVIGSLGHDFGTEANRDGFISQMAGTEKDGHLLPANPYDPRELGEFLAENPWFSDKLIWVCKHEGMPIYALEAESPVGMAWGSEPRMTGIRLTGFEKAYPPVSYVHRTFREALVGQVLNPSQPDFVSRISIPGRLTNRTIRLFSGQVLPVVVVQAAGLYTWNEGVLVDSLLVEIKRQQDRDAALGPVPDDATVRLILRAFLDKVYYEFRNLGQSGPDRALNYAATNAFSLVSELALGFLSGRLSPLQGAEPAPLYALDDIRVQPSQYSRMDSECYDVIITFFDPTNDRQARVAYLTVIDVSAVLPVALAPTRQFLIRS
jgi:hypothetical protein